MDHAGAVSEDTISASRRAGVGASRPSVTGPGSRSHTRGRVPEPDALAAARPPAQSRRRPPPPGRSDDLCEPDGANPRAELSQPGNLYGAFSMGNTMGSNPDVLVDGTATWSGVMFGLRISDPDVCVQGDALVTVSNTVGGADLAVDVECTNIKDEDTVAGLDSVSWNGFELKDGTFGVVPVAEDRWYDSRHPASEGISGRFYGSNHEEVGGLSVSRSRWREAAGSVGTGTVFQAYLELGVIRSSARLPVWKRWASDATL